MEIIRMNADDRNVATRKIYAKADGVAYIDKTLKVKATPAELEDAYIKGCLSLIQQGSCIVRSAVKMLRNSYSYIRDNRHNFRYNS